MPAARGVRARGAQSLTLFTTGMLVTSGCLVAVAYSRLAQLSAGPAAALLLVGAAAIGLQGMSSVRRRRGELALAQLRGLTGLRLLRFAVGEPTLVLLASAVVGTAVGWFVARWVVRAGLGGGVQFHLTGREWATVALVWAVGVSVVIAVSVRTSYEPLRDKLASRERPQPATTAGLFLSVLVLVAAAVSVYQARHSAAGSVDWVGYVSPALVGLAAGQIGVWLIGICARSLLPGTRGRRGLGLFLTMRRLARRADAAGAIGLVVAAVVLAGVASSAWFGASSWRDQMARLQTGGPIAFTIPGGGLRAYADAHLADPRGRWLMAMSDYHYPSVS
ncbi:MAG: FtsX-like permease family protein, partial [Sciscionella sp.]